MNLTVTADGPVTVLTVTGDLNVYAAPLLRQEITNAVEGGCYWIVVDLDGCTYMDSTGLGVLVGGLKRVRAHDGVIGVACTRETVLKAFRISGLSKVFVMHKSAADAVAALTREVADGVAL